MTTSPDRHQYRQLVAEVAARAKERLPQETNGRIESAVKLVLQGDVEPQADGTIRVGSSDPTRSYVLTGQACTCTDYLQERAPSGWCKHRISAGILKRVTELLPHEPAAPAAPAAPLPDAGGPGIDEKYVVVIQGTRFAKVAGLLALAHARGLQSLTTTFTYNDAELSIAQSTAVFPFGSFTDVGDASPANTNPKVRAHFRRVAATRATARALRLALNVDMCSVDELEGE